VFFFPRCCNAAKKATLLSPSFFVFFITQPYSATKKVTAALLPSPSFFVFFAALRCNAV
jgi:hypothetical protein